jgi:polyisoprenyl-phosphate glycosyltransferase
MSGESMSTVVAAHEARPLLSVVVPIYGEEELLETFNQRIKAVMAQLAGTYDHEIVYINDGSKDRSPELLQVLFEQDPHHIRVLHFSRNFGHQLAITAGMDHARGEAIVVIDGDLQDPPEVILEMVKKWQEGFDVVYGVREKRRGESFFKLATAKVYYRLLNSLSNVAIPVDTGDFRLISRDVVSSLQRVREHNRYIRGLISWLGFRQCGIYYQRDARFAGETKFSLFKMLKFAIDGITSFSEKPLYVSGVVGALLSVVGLLAALWIIMGQIFGFSETIRGWSSLMVTMLVVGGLQLFFMGIMGLYIGRIYRESKNRPLYVVARKSGYKESEVL